MQSVNTYLVLLFLFITIFFSSNGILNNSNIALSNSNNSSKNNIPLFDNANAPGSSFFTPPINPYFVIE